jgi:hypothetical protein
MVGTLAGGIDNACNRRTRCVRRPFKYRRSLRRGLVVHGGVATIHKGTIAPWLDVHSRHRERNVRRSFRVGYGGGLGSGGGRSRGWARSWS